MGVACPKNEIVSNSTDTDVEYAAGAIIAEGDASRPVGRLEESQNVARSTVDGKKLARILGSDPHLAILVDGHPSGRSAVGTTVIGEGQEIDGHTTVGIGNVGLGASADDTSQILGVVRGEGRVGGSELDGGSVFGGGVHAGSREPPARVGVGDGGFTDR